MHNLRELKIWLKAMELTKLVYQVVSEFPNEEKFGLTSQIKRSCISIPSNIAEGAGRNSNKEFIYFLSIANGSLYELQTQLQLAIDLKLSKENKVNPLIEMIIEIQKMNYSFQRKIK
ncbi:four helix bundle protein [Maribacter sp. 4G9]|uniref:four helix bundle protein n=1 Tax=Maribacter sp. 4G9 TaxID=1889777 RepID=UPI000C1478AA|nr:four helix bundle protein [Maribacter sp. 4G9]PIB39431.1 four helix bundle protein [Maribacter sp. 4G9]